MQNVKRKMQNNNSKLKIKKSFKLLVACPVVKSAGFILLGVVFSFALCFLSSASVRAANGSLYLSPSSGTYTVGNSFSVLVRVNTGGVAINAAQGTLVFPPDKLSVISISKSGSIFSLWTSEPSYSNSSGTINFGGGIPNPGYAGSTGKIITITFRARVSGVASVNWSSGAVLANDGKGTNILVNMSGGNYTLSPTMVIPPAKPITPPTRAPSKPEIVSSTHPSEDEWHSNSTVKLSWDLPSNVTGASVRLDQNAIVDPGPVPDGLFDSKIYEDIADGTWHFHLKLRNKYGWSPITHRKILVDITPPHPFDIEVKEGKETDNPQPILLFETKDDTSGIDYYELKIGEGDFFQWMGDVKTNPFKMPLQAPGKRTIIVKAVDKAGNNTAATKDITITSIESPIIIYCPTRITVGDPLEIKGRAIPGSTVKLFIQKEEGKLIKKEIPVDDNGNWSYLHDKILKKGIYSVWAETIDQRGAISYPCEKIIVNVGPPIFIKIGKIIIDYLMVIIILLILILLAIFGFYWAWYKFKLFRKRLRKETEEIERALHKAFDLLKEEITEQLRQLEKIKGKRMLTKKEKEAEEQLKKDLDIAEKYIGKEIKDVEEELKIT